MSKRNQIYKYEIWRETYSPMAGNITQGGGSHYLMRRLLLLVLAAGIDAYIRGGNYHLH